MEIWFGPERPLPASPERGEILREKKDSRWSLAVGITSRMFCFHPEKPNCYVHILTNEMKRVKDRLSLKMKESGKLKF